MTELIETIRLGQEKDFIDYLIAFAPIFLSLVAVIISIYAIKKQNAIALFEKRYQVIAAIRTILRFDEAICDCEDPQIIIAVFDAFWGSDLLKSSSTEQILKATSIISNTKNDILMGNFLFNIAYEQDVMLIIEDVRKIVSNAASNKINLDDQDRLHTRCIAFAGSIYSTLAHKTKL